MLSLTSEPGSSTTSSSYSVRSFCFPREKNKTPSATPMKQIHSPTRIIAQDSQYHLPAAQQLLSASIAFNVPISLLSLNNSYNTRRLSIADGLIRACAYHPYDESHFACEGNVGGVTVQQRRHTVIHHHYVRQVSWMLLGVHMTNLGRMRGSVDRECSHFVPKASNSCTT